MRYISMWVKTQTEKKQDRMETIVLISLNAVLWGISFLAAIAGQGQL